MDPTGPPIHDNHFHCRPDGHRGIDAAHIFQRAGGTSIAHVRLPSYPTTIEAFTQTCLDHIAFSERIRKEAQLTVWTAVGPYPLEIMKIAEQQGWEQANEFGRACYEIAAKLCEDGQAHCIGEVGRAHFDVPPETQQQLNQLLVHGMQLAKDAHVPIMLHTEHTEPETMAEFAAMADQAGLPRDRVIKHYCGPLVRAEEHHGLFPSVIAGRSNIRTVLQKGSDRFMLETDYIDEPTRPDVVMPPDTVPKRVLGLMQNNEISDTLAHQIGEVWPKQLYGES